MSSNVRIKEIKQLLLQNSFVSVSDLAQVFSVTEETIRRDLRMLERDGIVSRTHGGAVLKERVSTSFSRQDIRDLLQTNKMSMAETARHFIQNGDCIFMDSSSTVQTLFALLKELQLTIVTDSIDIMSACSNLTNIKLIGLGGAYEPKGRCFSGQYAQEVIRNFYFDISIVSCRTIDIRNGLTDSSIDEAAVKRLAIEHGQKTIVMADHTKFNRVSFAKICDLDQINVLITDEAVELEWKNGLREKQIELLVSQTKEVK